MSKKQGIIKPRKSSVSLMNRQKNGPEEESITEPIHTKVSFSFIILCAGIMLYLGVRYRGTQFGDYAFLHFGFVIGGYIISSIYFGQGLIPKEFKKLDLKTGVLGTGLWIILLVVQIVISYRLEVTNTDQGLFILFGSISEETFFRLFLIGSIIAIVPKNAEYKVWIITIGIIISSGVFTIMHTNYYGQTAVLVGVFISGIILGIFYSITKNITANYIGHFLLNAVATYQILVVLSIQGNSTISTDDLFIGICNILFLSLMLSFVLILQFYMKRIKKLKEAVIINE